MPAIYLILPVYLFDLACIFIWSCQYIYLILPVYLFDIASDAIVSMVTFIDYKPEQKFEINHQCYIKSIKNGAYKVQVKNTKE